MTIDKAIKVLERDRFDNPAYYLGDFQQAIQLGIEALKAYQYYRSQNLRGLLPNLPGETEE